MAVLQPTLNPFHLSLLIFSLLTLTISTLSLALALAPAPAPTPAHAPASSSSPQSVYQLLTEFGLPIGLLPDCIKSYSLLSNGTFIVDLHKPCYVHFDYLVFYGTHITGKLEYGYISDIKGIQVQRYFWWFDIDEIKVDLPTSESILIQVGFISRELDVSQFRTVRSCRDNDLAMSRATALSVLY